MNMKKRLKTKAVTMYVDQKYDDTLLWLKHTGSITAWFEKQLDTVKIDPDLMQSIKKVEALAK